MFSWNSLFDRVSASGLEEARGVSILVFLELALRHGVVPPLGGLQPGFQSLFSWNSLFDLSASAISFSLLLSFNPCFPGTRSSTWNVALHDLPIFMFQSLFSWNSLFDFDADLIALGYGEFQSLFSWNSLFDSFGLSYFPSPNLVSILVFLELALRRCLSFAHRIVFEVSILVFLELALRPVVYLWKKIDRAVSILVFLELALRLHDKSLSGLSRI